MTENIRLRQLPVRLPPHCDELLSSWIGRHAAFYAVPPLVMLRHCLPEVSSLRKLDLRLSGDQQIRLANMFAIDPTVVHRMTFAKLVNHRVRSSPPGRRRSARTAAQDIRNQR